MLPSQLVFKIQNNILALVNESLSEVEVIVLSNFIKWATIYKEFTINYLQIKNCKFTDEQM